MKRIQVICVILLFNHFLAVMATPVETISWVCAFVSWLFVWFYCLENWFGNDYAALCQDLAGLND